MTESGPSPALVGEVEHLRDLLSKAQVRGGRLYRENRRLHHRIQETVDRLDGIANEAQDDDPHDPAVWARYFTARTTASDLRALLDDGGEA